MSQGDDAEEQQCATPAPSPRRSNRRRMPNGNREPAPAGEPPNRPAVAAETRRNPKRKASETSKKPAALPAYLLQEALRPLEAKDIEDWEGWIELESEPAFFNIILRDLGVSNVRAQEIFTIDQASMDFLPKPVFGLIFLFQYHPTDDETENMEDTNEVWFANQTTNNACATVALLNIVMNATDAHLGEKLTEFKESTKDLNTALRGHCLSSNKFIRSIHNSFTRRMDHLNADLCLENNFADDGAKKARTSSGSKKGRKQARKKITPSDEYGFHFVAYVPAGSHVWELDGLKTRPLQLGSIDSEDWTAVARPHIEARMLQYEENQLSFNLLALCQSPLATHSKEIARAFASLRCLHEAMREQPDFYRLVSADEQKLGSGDASLLAEFELTDEDVKGAEISDSVKQDISQATSSVKDAHDLHQTLLVECKATMGEFRAEMMAMADDEQRVKGRRKDYSLALHKWVSKLAEKGALEDVIKAAA